MCICFFGTNLRPGLAFLLCFNRDEFLSRPTAPAHFWTGDQGHILAGRDLTAGGTWLGISLTGRVAFLTNLRAAGPIHYRQQAPADSVPGGTTVSCCCHSRGELTTHFLDSDLSPLEYCQALDLRMYHGFNLVCADVNNLTAAYTNNAAHAPGVMTGLNSAGPAKQTAAMDSTVATTSRGGHEAVVDRASGSTVATVVPGRDPAAVSTGAPLGAQALADKTTPPLAPLGMEATGSEATANAQQQQQQDLLESFHAALPQAQQGSQPGLWESAGGDSGGPSAAEATPTVGDVSSAQPLQAGKVYGLSNGRLNEWPKVQAGMEYFTQLLQKDELWEGHQLPFDELFEELLGNCSRQEQLQPTDSTTGQPLPYHSLSLEQHLEYIASSRFVEAVPSKFGLYGTRSQTIVAVWDDQVVQVQERNLVQEESLPAPAMQDPAANGQTAPPVQAAVQKVSTSSTHKDPGTSTESRNGSTSEQGAYGAHHSGDVQEGSAAGRQCRRVPGEGWTWQATRHTFSLKQLAHHEAPVLAGPVQPTEQARL